MKSTKKYNNNTIQRIFSCSKNLTALCICMCVDRGLLDYNTPICVYWPEFATKNKNEITLADLMRHEAGLANLSNFIDKETMLDQKPSGRMSKLIEESEQDWWILPNSNIINQELKKIGVLITHIQEVLF